MFGRTLSIRLGRHIGRYYNPLGINIQVARDSQAQGVRGVGLPLLNTYNLFLFIVWAGLCTRIHTICIYMY
jgi:hypothetical protein